MGSRYTQIARRGRPHAAAALSTHAFAGAGAFTVAGAPVARNTMLLEGGLDVGISRDVTLSLAYGGEAGSGAHRHGLSARLAVRF